MHGPDMLADAMVVQESAVVTAGGDVAERAARPPPEPLVDTQPVERVLAAGQPAELVAVRVLRQAHRARRCVSVSVSSGGWSPSADASAAAIWPSSRRLAAEEYTVVVYAARTASSIPAAAHPWPSSTSSTTLRCDGGATVARGAPVAGWSRGR